MPVPAPVPATVPAEVPVPAVAAPGSARRWAIPNWLESLSGWSWRLLLVGLAAFAVLLVLETLRVVVVALLVAVMAATLLAPVKRFFVRLRLPGLVAAWLALLIGIAIVAGTVWWISTEVTRELADESVFSDVQDETRNWLETGPLDLSSGDVDSLYERVGDTVTSGARSAGVREARMAVEVLGATFLVIVLVFFFLKDGAQMWKTVVSRVAPRRRDAVDRAGRRAIASIGAYVRGVAITGGIDALLIGVLLAVIGVPLVIPLAALTFFGAFFPIVGATTAGAIAALVALVAVGPQEALIVALGVLVIQQVEGDVILPVIMRRQVQLHPAVVLLALAVGGSVAGIVGAFVAVPFAAVVVAAVPELTGRPSHEPVARVPSSDRRDDQGNDTGSD